MDPGFTEENISVLQATNADNLTKGNVRPSFYKITEKPIHERGAVFELVQRNIEFGAGQDVFVNSLPHPVSNNELYQLGPGLLEILSTPMSCEDEADQHLSDISLVSEEKEEVDNMFMSNNNIPCSEFLPIIEYASEFLQSTVTRAHKDMDNEKDCEKIAESKSDIQAPQFRSKVGMHCIERYILESNDLDQDWKITIRQRGSQSDEVCDFHMYEVKFSLPTKKYPIAQATVSLYFTIEVARVLPTRCPCKMTFTMESYRTVYDPRKVILTDEMLLRVIRTKIAIFKQLQF